MKIPRCPECNSELTPVDEFMPPTLWQCWNGCGRAWSPGEKDTSPREQVYSFIYRYAPPEDIPDAREQEYCAWILQEEECQPIKKEIKESPQRNLERLKRILS